MFFELFILDGIYRVFYEGVYACFAQFDCQHNSVHHILKTLTL